MADNPDMRRPQPELNRFREPIYDVTEDVTGDNIYWVAYGQDRKPLPAGVSAPLSRAIGYDADGIILTKYNFDEEGALSESFHYHRDGSKAETTQYNPDGSAAYTYEHDASGNVRTKYRFENGQPVYAWEYGPLGNLVNEHPHYTTQPQPPTRTTSSDENGGRMPSSEIRRRPNGDPIFRSFHDTRWGENVDWVQYDQDGQPMEPGSSGKVLRAEGYNVSGQHYYTSVYAYDQNGMLVSQSRYDRRFGTMDYLCAKFDYSPNGNVEHTYEYYAGSGAVRDTFHDQDGKRRLVHVSSPRGPVSCYEYDADGRLTNQYRIGPQVHESVVDAYRAYVGNPHLQPHGFNPFGALNPDGSPMYGFGYNPDTGIVWHSGYTPQGDPIYTWGSTPQGDPLFPIDPSNR